MVNELLVFLARIGVIESKIAVATIMLSNSEVKSNSLSVTDMKVTIGLRWETSMNLALSESKMLGKNLFRVTNIDISTN